MQGWAPAVAGLGAHGCRVGRLRLQVWDTLIIVLIVVSSICIAIDSPRLAAAAAAGSPFEVQVSWWLEQLNLYFTVLFTLELMLKVVAHGLAFNGKTSFLKVNNVRKQVVRT